MEYLIITVLGLVIGSFLNVCIYRIPKDLSVVNPPSACPSCGKRLQPLELIPVISFLWLRGRCKGCGTQISWRYPLVEFLTGMLFLAAYINWGFTWETLKAVIFISLIIPIAFIDFEFKIIPNVLSIPGILIGLILSYQRIFDSLIGAALGFTIIFLIIILSRGGMGMGDAKLLAMFGAFWGWKTVLITLLIGSFFGSVVGVGLLIAHKIDRKTPIAFGPYLCLGSLVALFGGELLLVWLGY